MLRLHGEKEVTLLFPGSPTAKVNYVDDILMFTLIQVA